MSNISYSWPIQFVGNGASLKTVVDKYCKTNTSQKYLLNRIADSPFVYDGTTIISGSLTLDYSRGYWDKHPLYTLISDNIVYTGSLDISKWQVDNIVRYAQKSDLTQYITVEKTTDAYGQIALDKVYDIKNLFCIGDRRFASWMGNSNVRITDQTGEVIKNTTVKVIVGYKS